MQYCAKGTQNGKDIGFRHVIREKLPAPPLKHSFVKGYTTRYFEPVGLSNRWLVQSSEDLRLFIDHGIKALRCLHSLGFVHGDVKKHVANLCSI